MDPRLGTALLVLVGVPAVIVGYIYATEWILRLVPDRRRGAGRPWLWLLPPPPFPGGFLLLARVLTHPPPVPGRVPRLADDPDDRPLVPGRGGGNLRRAGQLRLVLHQQRRHPLAPQ